MPEAFGGLTEFGDRFFSEDFQRQNNQPVDDGLWRSDGTASGTKLIKGRTAGESCLSQFTPAGSIFFSVTCEFETANWKLWRSNGTGAGTVFVADVGNPVYDSATIGNLVFMTNWDLIQSDGTAAGTITLDGGNNVANLEAVGQALFFTDSPTGELYRYVP